VDSFFSVFGGGVVSKASFGGDRSAAGRYAAEQRWKGHSVGGGVSRNVREFLVSEASRLRRAIDQDADKVLAHAQKLVVGRGGSGVVSEDDRRVFVDLNDRVRKALVQLEASVGATLNDFDGSKGASNRFGKAEREIKVAVRKFEGVANQLEKELRLLEPNAFNVGFFGVEAKRTKNFFPDRKPTTIKGQLLALNEMTVRLVARNMKKTLVEELHKIDD